MSNPLDLDIKTEKEIDHLESIFSSLMVGSVVKLNCRQYFGDDIIVFKDYYSRLVITALGRIIPLANMDIVYEIIGHKISYQVSAKALSVIAKLYPNNDFPSSPFAPITVKLFPDADPANFTALKREDIEVGTEIKDNNSSTYIGIIAFVDETSQQFITADNHVFFMDNLSGVMKTGRTNLPFFTSRSLQTYLQKRYPDG